VLPVSLPELLQLFRIAAAGTRRRTPWVPGATPRCRRWLPGSGGVHGGPGALRATGLHPLWGCGSMGAVCTRTGWRAAGSSCSCARGARRRERPSPAPAQSRAEQSMPEPACVPTWHKTTSQEGTRPCSLRAARRAKRAVGSVTNVLYVYKPRLRVAPQCTWTNFIMIEPPDSPTSKGGGP
jgi:hypothetical protein